MTYVDLWVEFPDFPPERVAEHVTMPSGDIVCKMESGEALWFDANGNHPKSKLVDRDHDPRSRGSPLIEQAELLAQAHAMRQ